MSAEMLVAFLSHDGNITLVNLFFVLFLSLANEWNGGRFRLAVESQKDSSTFETEKKEKKRKAIRASILGSCSYPREIRPRTRYTIDYTNISHYTTCIKSRQKKKREKKKYIYIYVITRRKTIFLSFFSFFFFLFYNVDAINQFLDSSSN